MEKGLISVIMACKNEGDNVRSTVESILNNCTLLPEIIIVDDGSDDDCCSFARNNMYGKNVKMFITSGIGVPGARNLGAIEAKGDILVFCDAHIGVEKGWDDTLRQSFDNPDISALSPGIAPFANPLNVGYGQTWNSSLQTEWLIEKPPELTEIPLAPGGFQAIRRSVFEHVNGYNRGFRVWGGEDVELAFRIWLYGYKIYINPYMKVLHLFRNTHPYRVTMDDVHYNLLYMALCHFNKNRIAKTFKIIKNNPSVENLFTDIIFSSVLNMRHKFISNRKYDDDWFMNKFNIPF